MFLTSTWKAAKLAAFLAFWQTFFGSYLAKLPWQSVF
jgi:hypothetical protein